MRATFLTLSLCALGACKGTALTDFAGTSADSVMGDDDDDGQPPPPESEGDPFLLPPAQTDTCVFVVNPLRDTVTRVEVATLSVVTTPVGSSPTLVRTTADHEVAVVFNQGDDTVTLLDTDSLQARTVAVRPHLDTLELTPDGAWAILWRGDLAADEEPPSPEPDGLQAFNEVSLVRIADGVHFPMAVGFEPKMVRFTPDGKLAVVVSQGNLATIDLTAEQPVPRLFELEPDSLEPPDAEEVVVSLKGTFAWVRPFGATSLLVVNLATGEVTAVAAGGNPTDLDLSPDGITAVAVARDSAELWIYEADSPFAPAQVLPLPADAGYGSLLFSPGGQQAVLYTTASPVERMGVWDLGEGSIVERSLVKPVSAMAITPTGDSLLVFHTLEDGPATEPMFAGQHALTLLDLGDFRSNPLLLPSKPVGYANSTTGLRGYFVMENSPFFEVLDYVTLLHDQYRLASDPEFIGVLPDLDLTDNDEPRAWVSQEHDLGRISFFDPDDASMETLTGFELNSGVETP